MKDSATRSIADVASATTSAPPDKQGDPTQSSMPAMQANLLAQCPVLPPVSPTATETPVTFTCWGQHGPRVILVHGGVQGNLGGGPETFDKQEELNQKGWQVLRVYRPGFDGTPSRGPDNMDTDSVWIADLVGNGANLIGHSWGGAAVLLAAARRPEAVRALVLVEPAINLPPAEPAAISPEVKADMARRFRSMASAKTPAEFGRAIAASLNGDGSSPRAKMIAAKMADDAIATETGCAFLRAKMASPAELLTAAHKVASVGVPVLTITGGWSPSIDATGETLAKLMHGRHVVVPSSDHYVQHTNPQEFNTVVDAFMREAENRQP